MYEEFMLPHGIKFEAITRKQAQNNLTSFIQQIASRVEMLSRAIHEQWPEWQPDFSDASLAALDRWFPGVVETRAASGVERRAFEKQMGEAFACLNSEYVELTTRSMSYCIDIGIYVGEVVRHRSTNTYWALAKGGPSYVSYNRPVLTEDKYAMQYDPLLTGTGRALRYLPSVWPRKPLDSLIRVVDIWCKCAK